MKSWKKPESESILEFDLAAPIKPPVGLGGFSFKQTLSDFQGALTNKTIDGSSGDNFNYIIDSHYFCLTISTKQEELKIELDLFTGKMISIACGKGYIGKLENDIGIGDSILEVLNKDKTLFFNLDTSWFNRTPFDGLILYPPNNMLDESIEAAVDGTAFPDFKIETIELIDMNFDRENFGDGQLTFEEM